MPSDTADTAAAQRKLIAFPRRPGERRRAHELEFLPAALEIIETPVSPVGRIMMGVIVILVLVAITWACLGWLDIIATASGRLIPAGQVKVIQPFEIGVVKRILVAEGDHVRAGDMLIELDPTTNDADRDRFSRDLQQAELDAARLTAALADDVKAYAPPAGADAALVDAERRQLVAALAQYHAKIDGLDRQIEAKIAEREQMSATLAKLDASLPLLEEKARIYERLRQNEFTSKIAWLEAERSLLDARHDRVVKGYQLRQAEEQAGALRQQRSEAEADFHRQTLVDLAKATQSAADFRQEQIKASQRSGLQTLRAPVDGTVEQLAVHTIGGVVTPAQAMMVVVPDGSRLEVEAMLPNRDAGFVHAGQDAEVKIEAFTYTRYGLLHGVVRSVSRDTLRSDRDTTNAGGASSPGKAPIQGGQDADRADSAYVVRVALASTSVETEQGRKPLEPGMAVTAEIKTGQRRVIEYLLSPFMRYRHEGLTER